MNVRRAHVPVDGRSEAIMSEPSFKVSVARGPEGLLSIAGEWDALTAGRSDMLPWLLRPGHDAYIDSLFDDSN